MPPMTDAPSTTPTVVTANPLPRTILRPRDVVRCIDSSNSGGILTHYGTYVVLVTVERGYDYHGELKKPGVILAEYLPSKPERFRYVGKGLVGKTNTHGFPHVWDADRFQYVMYAR